MNIITAPDCTDFDFLLGPAPQVAPRLLGCLLIGGDAEQRLVGKIVETEAYDQSDAASHSCKGRTPRTEIMFGPPGHLYVYFTYGMHYCCNIVTGPPEHGSAVLIRAIEPISGQAIMTLNRHGRIGLELTNGPAKLCQAYGIDRQLNGHDLHEPPLQLQVQAALPAAEIIQATRIGISQAQDTPWRFYIANSPFVSRRLTDKLLVF